MSAKRKCSVAQMSQPTKPSPFELAFIAALLAARDKNSSASPAGNYIPEADSLLKSAALYLEQPSGEEQLKWMLDTLGYTSFTFDQLLSLVGLPEKEGPKKLRTMVGSITTRNGLEKAIRRYFSRPEAARIIRADRMTEEERKTLLEKREQAIQARAAKRVKRANGKKIQSA